MTNAQQHATSHGQRTHRQARRKNSGDRPSRRGKLSPAGRSEGTGGSSQKFGLAPRGRLQKKRGVSLSCLFRTPIRHGPDPALQSRTLSQVLFQAFLRTLHVPLVSQGSHAEGTLAVQELQHFQILGSAEGRRLAQIRRLRANHDDASHARRSSCHDIERQKDHHDHASFGRVGNPT